MRFVTLISKENVAFSLPENHILLQSGIFKLVDITQPFLSTVDLYLLTTGDYQYVTIQHLIDHMTVILPFSYLFHQEKILEEIISEISEKIGKEESDIKNILLSNMIWFCDHITYEKLTENVVHEYERRYYLAPKLTQEAIKEKDRDKFLKYTGFTDDTFCSIPTGHPFWEDTEILVHIMENMLANNIGIICLDTIVTNCKTEGFFQYLIEKNTEISFGKYFSAYQYLLEILYHNERTGGNNFYMIEFYIKGILSYESIAKSAFYHLADYSEDIEKLGIDTLEMIVKYFIKHGAYLEKTDGYEKSPYEFSLALNKKSLARLLAENGANTNSNNIQRSNPSGFDLMIFP